MDQPETLEEKFDPNWSQARLRNSFY